MNRRSFFGVAIAGVTAHSAAALGLSGPRCGPTAPDPVSPLSLFEPVDWEGAFIDVLISLPGKTRVSGDGRVWSVAGFTLTHNEPPSTYERVVLQLKYGEGESEESARADVLSRLGREATLLSAHTTGGRKLWFRPAAGLKTLWSPPRGVWKAWCRSALLVVPEFA